MLSSASAGHFPSNNPLNLNGLGLNNPWAPPPAHPPHQHQHQHLQQHQQHGLAPQAGQLPPAPSSQLQLPKPSPLSSADNAPRSTHLNAVQAVHTYYSNPSSYTHTNHSATNSNSTSTSSLGTFSSPPQQQQQQQHKLRRMPGGANLAEYRQPPPPPAAAPLPPPPPHHTRTRTSSLSIPKTSKMSVNGAAASPPSARGMPSLNAIAAGPGPSPADAGGQGRAAFDGPRSPPSECLHTIRNHRVRGQSSIPLDATATFQRTTRPSIPRHKCHTPALVQHRPHTSFPFPFPFSFHTTHPPRPHLSLAKYGVRYSTNGVARLVPKLN